MEAVERAAHISVGRACGFAGLGILTFMTGMSFNPELAAKSGGLFCLLMALYLTWRALTAVTWPYKRTETWLMLGAGDRPSPQVAQRVIGTALSQAFGWYAQSTSLAALVLFAAAVVLSLI